MKYLKTLALVLALTLSLGCAKRVVVANVPGSVNAFDSETYLSLVTTDSLIQSTKASLASNSFPVAWVGNVKQSLNALVQAYDVANLSYQAYHTMALAGTLTPVQQAAVSSNMAAVQTATVNLTSAKGGN